MPSHRAVEIDGRNKRPVDVRKKAERKSLLTSTVACFYFVILCEGHEDRRQATDSIEEFLWGKTTKLISPPTNTGTSVRRGRARRLCAGSSPEAAEERRCNPPRRTHINN